MGQGEVQLKPAPFKRWCARHRRLFYPASGQIMRAGAEDTGHASGHGFEIKLRCGHYGAWK